MKTTIRIVCILAIVVSISAIAQGLRNAVVVDVKSKVVPTPMSVEFTPDPTDLAREAAKTADEIAATTERSEFAQDYATALQTMQTIVSMQPGSMTNVQAQTAIIYEAKILVKLMKFAKRNVGD